MNNPFIIHCFGRKNKDFLGDFSSKKMTFCDDLSVFSAISCEKSDRIGEFFSKEQYKCVVSDKKNWENKDKIELYRQCLEQCNTKFALLIDNSDTFVLSDFPRELMSYDIVCQFQDGMSAEPKFKVNSGVVFGKTELLFKWFSETAQKEEYLGEVISRRYSQDLLSSDQIRLNLTFGSVSAHNTLIDKKGRFFTSPI